MEARAFPAAGAPRRRRRVGIAKSRCPNRSTGSRQHRSRSLVTGELAGFSAAFFGVLPGLKPDGARRCLSNAPSITRVDGCRHFFRFEVGIVQWLLFPVAVIAGTLMVVQSGCNGMLEKIIDRPVMVGVVSQGIGLTTLMIASIATGELGFPDNSRVMQGPWWAWVGGLCGAVSLLSQPIAAPRLGAGTYIGLFITASSVMSVIFDHFGWLGFAEHPAGVARVVGCALMLIGIALISVF